MIELGQSLRQAREAKGLSMAELAELTHMGTTTIEELENEDFSRIPAPIYGRGFIKLYCEAVGLEPKPYIDEFMSIYNGDREPVIRERIAEASPDPAAPVVEPVAAMPEPVSKPPPEPTEVNAATPAEMELGDLFAAAAEPPPAPKAEIHKPELPRYAPPGHDLGAKPAHRPISMPNIPWRMIVLAVGTILLLTAIICSLRMLYRATTSTSPAGKPAVEEKAEPKAKAKAKPETKTETKKTTRQAQAIPSLYID